MNYLRILLLISMVTFSTAYGSEGTSNTGIDVNNTAPVADAGPNQLVATAATVTLDGSGSFDADGDALIYYWKFISKPAQSSASLSSATTVSPTFTADVEGRYVVGLVVHDGTVRSNVDSVIIMATNTAPVADAGANQLVATAATVTLDGSGSFDANGDALIYYWKFISKPVQSSASLSSATTVSPTFTADVKGKYVLALVVYDGTVKSDPDSVIIMATTAFPANLTIDNPALQKVIASTFDDTPYSPPIDIQGVIDAGGLTVTVPYTVVNAPVTLPAYSTSVTLDASVTEDDEAGIIATFAWEEQTDMPVGSGTFTATITIDDSGAGIPDNTYNAKKLDIQDDIAGVVAATFPYATDDVGGTGTLTLKIMPGIPDRMFGRADNTGDDTTHEFLYLPVTNTTTGKTWLSNNLGANYANINSSAFDITQQATASNDYNAYGSLFQWGRKADGHELITWTDGATGAGVNGTTTTNSDDPTDALFILETSSPHDWRVTQDDMLWASESSANNVCPVGYRVPTSGELDEERVSWGSNDAAGALASMLVLPVPGYRSHFYGMVFYEGTSGYYWGSTVSGTYAQRLRFHGWNAYMYDDNRAHAFTVRCLKD